MGEIKCNTASTPKPCNGNKDIKMVGIAFTDESGKIVRFIKTDKPVIEK